MKSNNFWLGFIIGVLTTIVLILVLMVGNVISFDIDQYLKNDINNTPTPKASIRIGNSIISDELQISLTDYKFSDIFVSEDGSETPPPGAKYLIVNITVSNIGDNSSTTPDTDSYHVVHSGKKIRFESNSSEYESVELFPGYETEGRIRAIVPEGAEPETITIYLHQNNTNYSWFLSK